MVPSVLSFFTLPTVNLAMLGTWLVFNSEQNKSIKLYVHIEH